MTHLGLPRKIATLPGFALVLALAAAFLFQLGSSGTTPTSAAICNADGGPAVVTDKEEYLPEETAVISGCGFNDYIGQTLTLRITEPNAYVFTDTLSADASGNFTYNYLITPGFVGTYLVEVLDSSSNVLATTTFLDDYYVSPTSLTFVATQGSNPASQMFTLVVPTSCSNSGSVSDNQTWISTSPTSYSSMSSGPGSGNKHKDITVSIASSSLSVGTYTGTVTANPGGSYPCDKNKTVSITLYVVEPNPTLSSSCGLDMALVIDSSASIDSTELSQMKTAFNSFVSAFLPSTPTQIAVVEFDSSASVTQGFTSTVSSLNSAINAASSGGFTNWDDALYDSRNLFPNRAGNPDLIVFASDGNPTQWGGNSGDPLTSDFGGSTALAKAIAEANAAKAAGIRVITLGIGNDLSTTNLAAISSADAVTTSNFSTLATDLANLANDMCGGTITIQKILDADGNTATTGDQTPGVGWTVATSVSTTAPNGDDTVTPASGVTDGDGKKNFALNLGANAESIATVSETLQANHTFLSASCTGAYNNGTESGNGVSGIVVQTNNIVNCKIYNQPPAFFTVNKVWSPASGASVNVSVTCTSGTVAGGTQSVSTASPQTWTVTAFTGAPTCTATETVPAGYIGSGSPAGTCSAGLLTPGNCTITNTLRTAQVVVNKDFSDNNAANVTVALTCTSGSVANDDVTASEADPANFTVTGWNAGATCTATETVPSGYGANQAACAGMALTQSGTATCTIVNTLSTANFNVNKDFSDNNAANVTVSLSCASGTVTNVDTTASEADDANFTVTGYSGDPNCTATESAIPAGYSSSGTCSASLTTGVCTITNTLNSATFNVSKDFSDNSGAAVTVSLSCTSGTVVTNDGTATETPADTADFTVNGFSAGATCTATESVPAGYTANQAACATVAISAGGTASCTITNTLNSATINVSKDFSDNSAAAVTVSVTCSSGTVTTNDATATESPVDTADFTVTGFTDPGTTCTATETVPAGYTANQAACANLAVSPGGTAACTITNTLNTAGFNVNKDFSDNNAANVVVSLSCASGTVTSSDTTASEADAADFTVSGFTGDPSCTATESPIPSGYNSSGTCTAALSAGSCTIVNTLNSATINVSKDFSDNSGAAVTVSVSCTSGTVTTNDGTATETPADTADFTVTGFNAGATCTATETVPAGYTANQAACASLAISHGGTATCTITNTLNTAAFNVNKDFSDNNAADVTVSVSCASGTVTSSDTTASEADAANFTVSGYSGDPSCTATESPVPAGYTSSGTCSASLSAGSCTIVNTLNSATINVSKDFSDNSAAAVTVSVTCTSGTVATNDATATESPVDTADFTVTGFTHPGTTCTATETVPAGYTASQAACANLAVSPGGTASCTITNTLNSAAFDVNKDFSDNNPANVTVSLSCASGTVASSDTTASESDAANFTVTGFSGNPSCTATESALPAGYNSTGTCSATLSAGSCTIVNNLNSAQVVVNKDFSDNNASDVTVSVTCTSGSVANDDTTASEADPANFTVTGFTAGTTCTATETVPLGYTASEAGCANMPVSDGGTATCTITNTLNVATFTVNKDFVPNNALGSATVSLSCASGTAVPPTAVATEALGAVFTVSGFTGNPNCTATESPIPAGYTSSGTCSAALATGSCTIVNTQLGTITVQKTTNPALDPQTFTVNLTGPVNGSGSISDITDFSFNNLPAGTYSLSEVVPAGWTLDGVSCGDQAANAITINAGDNVTCVFTNTKLSTIIVQKTTTPAGSAQSFPITVTGPTPGSGSVTDATDAFFSNVYPGSYDVDETVPLGWQLSDVDCGVNETSQSLTGATINVPAGTTVTCTFSNATMAEFTVSKDFQPDNPATVIITLNCASGGTGAPEPADEANPAVFGVTGFSGDPLCTATETGVPAGYTTNSCAALLSAGGCTIVNPQTGAAFQVNKDFSDNNAADVNVSLSCVSGTVSAGDPTASESDPADFTVTGFVGDPLCTATESPIPAGYTSTGTCAALLSAGSCTITNTQTSAAFQVNKDFSDNNAADVIVTLSCASGVALPTDSTASEADPADFTVLGFSGDPSCTATETPVPAGYTSSGTCTALLSAGSCTITNTLNTASFNVNKDFSDNNAADVNVSLSCASGTVSATDSTASEADDANFTVTGFVGDPLCTATESSVPAGYSSTGTCAALLSAGSCTIVNTLRSATLTVNKDFVPDNGASVNVSVTCTSGTPTPSSGTATEASPFMTTVTGFNVGATCTATESPVPAGYTANQAGCAAVPIVDGVPASCTIINALVTANFNVNKDFSDNNAADVTVSLSCASGTVSATDATASESDPADFTVAGYTGDPLCTATESPVPAGYNSTGTCSAPLSAGSCTIVNNLNTPTPSPTPVPPTPTPVPPTPTPSPTVAAETFTPAPTPSGPTNTPNPSAVGGIVDIAVDGGSVRSASETTSGTISAALLAIMALAVVAVGCGAAWVARRR